MNTLLAARNLLGPALALVPSLLPAQEAKVPSTPPVLADHKPPRMVDPIKGYGEVAAAVTADRTASGWSDAEAATGMQLRAGGPTVDPAMVFYTANADGCTWASGNSYKASFGPEGFRYVPFLGSTAPRNYPVQFTLRGIQIRGKDVAFARDVAPVRDGDRIVFDRGIVREVYDLRPGGIEQTFALPDAAPGDVVVEMSVVTELAEDATRAGLQFVNALGGVEYGTAFVVDGAHKRAIESTFVDGVLRLGVAAAQRPAGALVIDPVISTTYTSATATQDFDEPDAAFDATNQCYLLVWQRNFSASDYDVWTEMRDIHGALVVGSAQYVENGTLHWGKPRVANLNAYDRFLVVAEQFTAANPAGQQYSIWGRTLNAGSPFTMGAPFQVSGNEGGDKRGPDIGGDPSTVTPTYWTVAYTREWSATDHDIHARQIGANSTIHGGTIPIENTANTVFRDVQISQGNGALNFSAQRWMLVYRYQFSPTDSDIYGATLTWDGQIARNSTSIDTTLDDSIRPHVSSATHFGPQPTFAVAYNNANVFPRNIFGVLLDDQLARLVGPTDMVALLNRNAFIYEHRIETDGGRFVMVVKGGATTIGTIAVIGNQFVSQDYPSTVNFGQVAEAINLTSRGNAGGSNTGYGLIYADANTFPQRITFVTFEGHGAGGFAIRPTGCNGLGISVSGRAVLGSSPTVTLTNVGSEYPGMVVGLPASVPMCAGCVIGIDLNGPVQSLPGVASFNLDIPYLPYVVGLTLTVQGCSFGAGPCLGFLRLGDSLDVTVQ